MTIRNQNGFPLAGAACLREELERLYREYNRPEWISPDPLECVIPFENTRDREIAALVASSLAYGRIRQILKSVRKVLDRLGESPRLALENSSRPQLERDFSSFRHRFTSGEDLVDLLWGARKLCLRHGGLESAFLSGSAPGETYVNELELFIRSLEEEGGAKRKNSLLCRPSWGSACKRHWLFLKWMIRSDAVDPGGWSRCDPARLVIPLDTHMHRIGRALAFTRRNAADLKSAMEITRSFRVIAPRDPTRYDFVLTRFGIREDLSWEDLLRGCKAAAGRVDLPEDRHSGQEEEGEGQGSVAGRPRKLQDRGEQGRTRDPRELAG